MLNIFIAYDNLDLVLGSYFEESRNQILPILTEHFGEVNIIEANTSLCNVAFLEMQLAKINSEPFIFINYSHGTKDSLMNNTSGKYVSVDNCHILINSLAYCMSCYCSEELGLKAIDSKTLSFIGFNKKAKALLGKYQALSILCDNYGLILFIKGMPLDEAIHKMKEHFTIKADHLESIGEVFAAADLKENRDCLDLLGNNSLTRKHFHPVN